MLASRAGSNGYPTVFSGDYNGGRRGKPIASGKKTSGIMPLGSQRSRYPKIEQNGSGGGYWFIHELYLLNLDENERNQ